METVNSSSHEAAAGTSAATTATKTSLYPCSSCTSCSGSSSSPSSGSPGSDSGSGSGSESSSTTSTLLEEDVNMALPKYSLVPPKWSSSVRVVSLRECRAAALSLAHAFAADEYARYLVDPGDKPNGTAISPEDKWRLHVDIMTYAVAAHCLSGLVTTTGPDYDSVALWLPPGKDLDSWLTVLRSGLWRLRFSLSAEGRARYFDEIVPLLRDTKASVLGDRDAQAWYLVYLGTKPNSQRKGFAHRLLDHVAEQADSEGRPVYLESSSAENNAFYTRYGFEVRRDVYLCRASAKVKLSVMVREPREPREPRGRKVARREVPISVGKRLVMPMPVPMNTPMPVVGGAKKGKGKGKGKAGKGGVLRGGRNGLK